MLQNDLFAIFHSSLKDSGYLFLGRSEAIGVYTEAYPVVDAAAKLFRHRSEARIAGAKAVPFLQASLGDDYFEDEIRISHRVVPGEMNLSEQEIIDTSLLEQFMPACLIVNSKNELIHTYGENSNYIHFSIGKVSNSLYDVVTEGLKIPVSTLLKEARERKQTIQYKDICFKGEREDAVINLSAMPISKKNVGNEEYYALVFTEETQRGEIKEAIPYEIDKVASQRITDLELDLGEAQERLKKSINEQECVNEELQAANEELLTANEELQSSNEELQSVNEELYTVNTEYQVKLTELADMNDDLANFLASTLIGIIFVDNKMNIRRYTDYVASEFSVMDHDIGRSLKFLSYHFPTIDISEICDNILKTLVADEREVTTGKNKVFLMRVAPYRTTENKILGCVITLVDVTKQKQGQVQLESTEQRLNMAKQANEAKGEFLSKIAHEIKMPMNELTLLAEQARDIEEDREALDGCLGRMSETIKYMNSIVSDIMEMTETDQMEMKMKREVFSIQELISELVDSVSLGMETAGLRFMVEGVKEIDAAYIGNKGRVQQILMNFLNNSMKYTPNGGEIRLTVAEEGIVNNKAALCFVVEDTGIGISEEFLPNLFKPFEQENRLRLEESNGVGLGLSIAYNLIKMMDGNVIVQSEVNKGTSFTIHIMLERHIIQTREKGEAQHRNHLAGFHALVVDDNEMNRKILGAVLEHEGMTVEEAEGGNEAFQAYYDAPEGTFDCIMMDIRMPEVGGIQATEMIRQSGKGDAATIPIIGVTANGYPEDKEKAQLAGMDSYSTKPIDNAKLLKIISDLITRK